MDRCITTDAQRDPFNYHLALKSIHDHLTTRDVKAMKFLCNDLIPPQKMEKVKTALELFGELKMRGMISPPDKVTLVAEILCCIRQNRLIENLHLRPDIVRQHINVGRGQLSPCRVFLYNICEDITSDRFHDICHLCPEISRSSMEKIKDPQDLILALEKLNLVKVAQKDLKYLRRLMYESSLQELVARIDQFNGGGMNPLNNLSTAHHDQQARPQRTFTAGAQNTATYATHSNNETLKTLYARPDFSGKSLVDLMPTGACSDREQQQTTHHADPLYYNRAEGGAPLSGSLQTDYGRESNRNRESRVHNADESTLPSYSMTHTPRGICLIINIENFYIDKDDNKNQVLKVRKGSKIDSDELQKLFEELHFRVEVFEDLSDKELCEQLHRTASEDHTRYDCFVCFILSHGTEGAIYGANGKEVQIDRIKSYFKPSQCRSLFRKPKLFFLQACQGKYKQNACDLERDGPSTAELIETRPNVESLPEDADFLVALASVPGFASFRYRSKGSWYIQALVELLRKHAGREDLLSILGDVNRKVSEKVDTLDGTVCKQMPMPMTTLTKKVFFR